MCQYRHGRRSQRLGVIMVHSATHEKREYLFMSTMVHFMVGGWFVRGGVRLQRVESCSVRVAREPRASRAIRVRPSHTPRRFGVRACKMSFSGS